MRTDPSVSAVSTELETDGMRSIGGAAAPSDGLRDASSVTLFRAKQSPWDVAAPSAAPAHMSITHADCWDQK